MGDGNKMIEENREFEMDHFNEIYELRFSRNGEYFVCLTRSDSKYTLVVYEVKTKIEKCSIILKNKPNHYECFDNGSTNYILAAFIGGLYLWNIDTGENCGELKINVTASLVTGINDYSLSNDGHFVGYIAYDKTLTLSNKTFVRFFNIETGEKIHESKHGNPNKSTICISPDNRYVVILFLDITSFNLQIFELKNKKQLVFIEKINFSIKDLNTNQLKAKFHPNGSKIFFTSNTTIYVFDMENKKIEQYLELINPKKPNLTKKKISYFEFNHDGSLIMVKIKNEIFILDSITGQLISKFESENEDYRILASMSTKSNHMLLCNNQHKLKIIDLSGYAKDEFFQLDNENEQICFKPFVIEDDTNGLLVSLVGLLSLAFVIFVIYNLANS